jgi:hypothetical protein
MASVDASVVRPKANAGRMAQRRYTFSVVEMEPVSPKTPALVGKNWSSKSGAGGADPVISVPAMIDNSVIMIQNRMDPVSAALREDPDAFDQIDHRMEFDMLNSVYKTVQNIAYHMNKLMRSLNPREEKWPRPVNGEDGLDMISGMRSAMNRCQQGGTKLTQLVKDRKKMLGAETTKDVLGEEGIMLLEQIETAMTAALMKSAKLVDALEAAKKNRTKALLQNAAAAFFQVQGDKGSTEGVLKIHFYAWKEALVIIKEERAAEEAKKDEPEE